MTLSVEKLPELYYLVLTCLLTGLMFLPYLFNRLFNMGLLTAASSNDPKQNKHCGWAERLMAAHRNAIENLVVFAPLAMMVAFLRLSTDLTAMAAMVFFYSRLAHMLIYTFNIPFAKGFAFLAGVVCQVIFALSLLGVI